MAISQQLVEYWRQRFGYHKNSFSIVPCTLHSGIKWAPKVGSHSGDTVRVLYAGSNAPWQGFEEITHFLSVHPEVSCTLLTRTSELTQAMQKQFGDRLEVKWLSSEKVAEEMAAHDYGLLLRPETVTNKVASPGKFAEYLSCGLSVIISENLGDYSSFVREKDCGQVWDKKTRLKLGNLSREEKERNHQLAVSFYRKTSDLVNEEYSRVIEAIST